MKSTKNKLYTIIFIFIFFNIELSSQSIQWNPKETGYYQIIDNELIFKSTKGKKDLIILSKKDISPNNGKPLEIKNYSFSKDREKILIFTNTKKVWRYETKGDYWVFNLKNKELKKLGNTLPESSLMFAKFSPDGKNIAYVSKENSETNTIRNSSTNANIYIENLTKNTIKKSRIK